jgi:hypothetical protein
MLTLRGASAALPDAARRRQQASTARDGEMVIEWLPTGVLRGVRRTVPGAHPHRHLTVLELFRDRRCAESPLPTGLWNAHQPGMRRRTPAGRRTHVRRVVVGMALLVGLVATSARAQGWSAMSGQTLGSGAGMVWGQFGWPGISADLAYGVSPTVDLGGRFGFNYGEEGITDTGVLGLRFQFTLRGQLVKKPKFDLALRFDPGLLLYFPSNTTVVGMTFPVGLEFGFPITPVLRANGSFDLPFWITFSPSPVTGYIPILFGGGVEYLVQHDLALTARLKMGPTIATGNRTRNAFFTLYFLFGLAYRF